MIYDNSYILSNTKIMAESQHTLWVSNKTERKVLFKLACKEKILFSGHLYKKSSNLELKKKFFTVTENYIFYKSKQTSSRIQSILKYTGLKLKVSTPSQVRNLNDIKQNTESLFNIEGVPSIPENSIKTQLRDENEAITILNELEVESSLTPNQEENSFPPRINNELNSCQGEHANEPENIGDNETTFGQESNEDSIRERACSITAIIDDGEYTPPIRESKFPVILKKSITKVNIPKEETLIKIQLFNSKKFLSIYSECHQQAQRLSRILKNKCINSGIYSQYSQVLCCSSTKPQPLGTLGTSLSTLSTLCYYSKHGVLGSENTICGWKIPIAKIEEAQDLNSIISELRGITKSVEYALFENQQYFHILEQPFQEFENLQN